MVRAEEKMISEGHDPQFPEQALVNEAVIPKLKELEIKQPKAFVTEALRVEQNLYARHSNSTETFTNDLANESLFLCTILIRPR